MTLYSDEAPPGGRRGLVTRLASPGPALPRVSAVEKSAVSFRPATSAAVRIRSRGLDVLSRPSRQGLKHSMGTIRILVVRTSWCLAAVLAQVLACGAVDDEDMPSERGDPPDASSREAGSKVDAGKATLPSDAGDGAASDPPLSCMQELEARGVPFTPTTARGVVDAVRVEGRINGVLFGAGQGVEPTEDPMACKFVLTLWDFASLLAEFEVDRVGTLGAYCYRCCCAWSATNDCRAADDPEPSCGEDGYSNHSFGRALDVRYLFTSSGDAYDINSNAEWRITAGETCGDALGKQAGTSRMLYTLACKASERGIFSTILTPNYNGAHRNHWHMDTADRDDGEVVIRSMSVPRGPLGVDVAGHDVCGAASEGSP